jgi:peptidoglycan/xylan/chitin deacetylase (PgdA/CDA1 family)
VSKTLTVFFRFDDFSATSDSAVEQGLIGALDRNGVSATFAVIPAVTEGRFHDPSERGVLPLGPEKIRVLQLALAAGVVDVALHGWNHRSRFSSSPHGEFVGLGIDDQVDRLRRGRAALAKWLDAETQVFVPPWNRYDGATIEALTREGFTCISANRYGPFQPGSLRFAPITADIASLRSAIAVGRQTEDPAPIVGILLHPYDFNESGDPRGVITCGEFEAELRWLSQQRDVRVVSIGRLASENGTLHASRYRANQPLPFESILPPWIRTTSETPLYLSERMARKANVYRALGIVVTYLVAALVGVTVARLMTAVNDSAAEPARYFAAAVALAIVGRAVLQREIHARPMLVAATALGMLVSF